ncbi:winged helix DNA-binding domain-containing protein [Nocardioidaceae bacterium]|nr:winged helix DNA-binding domain-containing protein [Nocardioidaceae bacterium]
MPSETLTARGWNRALLARQLLLERSDLDVVPAVRSLLAVQSQSAPSAYLALWNRLARSDLSAGGRPGVWPELDVAYADGRLVKASLMRLTLQTVTAEDLPTLTTAMRPLLRDRLGDARFADGGVARDEALAAAPEFLAELHEPRTNEQMDAWTQSRFGQHPTPSVWWAMRYLLPVAHTPTGGPWSFGQKPAFRATGHPMVDADDLDGQHRAEEQLVRRYLAAFGPATVADIAQFTVMRRAPVTAAVARLGDELTEVAVEGVRGRFLDLADTALARRPDPGTPAPPRLLGMWDDALLGSADRSRTLPPAIKAAVVRRNGDVLPSLLVDGSVAGVWRVTPHGDRHRIEAHALIPIATADWDGLEAEATALLPLLAEREPAPYARYDHWWDKHMPSVEVRLLG